MVPPTTISDTEPVELVDVHVDWEAIADSGFQDNMESLSESTLNAGQTLIDHFIRAGSPISICGVTHHGGYESARRVLLDFANLMEGVSRRELRTFTQVLHIMSDDVTNVDTMH
jgi:hypothetical protein